MKREQTPQWQRLRQIMQEAMDRSRRNAELVAARSGPPQPGDVFRPPLPLDEPVFFAFVQPHGDDDGCVYAVPTDDRPFVGVADVPTSPEAVHGPLVLRCGHGIWAQTAQFPPELRIAVLDDPIVRQAQTTLAQVVQGQLKPTPSQEETEADPEYHDWMDEVVKARNQLETFLEKAPLVFHLADFRRVDPRRKPARQSAPESFSLAAASGGLLAQANRLLASASRASDPIDQRVAKNVRRVPLRLPGECLLEADSNGVSVYWSGSGEPPRLQARGAAGKWKSIGWQPLGVAGSFESTDRSPWIGAEVHLRIGPGRGQTVTVRQ
jgi:hypothetical protein